MKPEKNIFYIGQQFRIQTEKPNRKAGKGAEGRIVTARILKLYKNFALCRVNERYNECFDYEKLKESAEISMS